MIRMRAIARLALLPALFLLSSGCGLFCYALNKVGLRREEPVPVSSSQGAILEAHVAQAGSKLCIRYRVGIGRGEYSDFHRFEERWLTLDREEIFEAVRAYLDGKREGDLLDISLQKDGTCVVRLAQRLVERGVTRRAPYDASDWVKVKPGWTWPPAKLPEGPFIGVYGSHSHHLYYVMDLPETEGREVIMFWLPTRYHHTPAGRVVQIFMPVTIALDVATSPIQAAYCCIYMWSMGPL